MTVGKKRKEEAAFLEAILDAIEDDGPRLVYADWLTDNGNELRAEFIRVQCELAKLPTGHERRVGLQQRERELLSSNQCDSGGELRSFLETDTWKIIFHRGLPHTLQCTDQGLLAFFAHHPHPEDQRLLCNLSTMQHVSVGLTSSSSQPLRAAYRSLRDGGYFKADESNLLGQVRSLKVQHGRENIAPRASILNCLLSLPGLMHLRRLDLSNTYIEGMPDFDSRLARLEELLMASNYRCGDGSCRLLSRSPHLGNLRRLDLSHNQVTDEGATYLGRSRCLENLIEINIEGCRITARGLRELAGLPRLETIEGYDLSKEWFWTRNSIVHRLEQNRLRNRSQGQPPPP